jgi:hypothetical protein
VTQQPEQLLQQAHRQRQARRQAKLRIVALAIDAQCVLARKRLIYDAGALLKSLHAVFIFASRLLKTTKDGQFSRTQSVKSSPLALIAKYFLGIRDVLTTGFAEYPIFLPNISSF